MESSVKTSTISPIDARDAFSRQDGADDRIFYETDRFVSHLDAFALSTVESIIGQLIVEEHPVILDLMAGWDSHIPEKIKPSKVVGLGLNQNELSKNSALDEYVLHDLNINPALPFPDAFFDVVLNTVSVDYLVKPVEIFKEVGRILKPGGLFLVIFSNRFFPQKVVRVWQEADEESRVLIVEEFFERTGLFDNPAVFVSKGKPRPAGDKYAHLNIPSDPIYAVYEEKKGAYQSKKPRPVVNLRFGQQIDAKTLEEKKRAIKQSMCCPYCGERLKKWKVPDNAFSQTWINEFMYICFNDSCPYYVRGWDHMSKGGTRGVSYRCMYIPDKDICRPIPVPSPKALREGIIEEDE